MPSLSYAISSFVFLPIAILCLGSDVPLDAYLTLREETLTKNSKMAFDASTELAGAEVEVGEWLSATLSEYTLLTRNKHEFPPTNFFYSWDLDSIRQSTLYKTVEAMPKGGALHLHSGSSGSTDWILSEGIMIEGCHVYWGPDDFDRCINGLTGAEVNCGEDPVAQPLLKGTLAFYGKNSSVPAGFEPGSKHHGSKELRDFLTSNASLEAMDSATAWGYFNNVFTRVNPAMANHDFYFQYLLNTFAVHFYDNVQHVEIRALCGTGGLGDMIDLNGRVYSGDEIIDVYRQALIEFRSNAKKGEDRSGFTLKLIVSSLRVLPEEHIEGDVKEALRLKQDNADLVIGFDIVAEEDPNHRTLDYIDEILELKRQETESGVSLPLYFHDGESDDRNNTNMIDAVLLGSKRVGHGFNSYYFPILYDMMRDNNVALEVNPISNQVLRYVDNLEVHPVNSFLAQGVQVVISSDDPGVFGYDGLTLDMWTALVAFQLDLAGLKTLCRNSLEHSGLEVEEKQRALERWEQSWEEWVGKMAQVAKGKESL